MSKNTKTPAGYIENLWSQNKLEKFTIDDVLKYASSDGRTFERNAVRMALLRAEFIVKRKKPKGKMTYNQKYPCESNLNNITNPVYVDIFNKLHLHDEIRKVSSKLFLDEHYEQAVFAAFKKINNLVKKKSNQPSKDGKDLMLSTFSQNAPILTLNKFTTKSEKNEQEGFMHIFAGVMQGIRNPGGHDDEASRDPWETIEFLCLASLLVKKLDKSKLNKSNKKFKKDNKK